MSLKEGRSRTQRGSEGPECKRPVSITEGEDLMLAVKCVCARDVYLLSLSFSPPVVDADQWFLFPSSHFAAQCNDFVQWTVVNARPETQPSCNVESQDWFIGTRFCRVWLVHVKFRGFSGTEKALLAVEKTDSALETRRCNEVKA